MDLKAFNYFCFRCLLKARLGFQICYDGDREWGTLLKSLLNSLQDFYPTKRSITFLYRPPQNSFEYADYIRKHKECIFRRRIEDVLSLSSVLEMSDLVVPFSPPVGDATFQSSYTDERKGGWLIDNVSLPFRTTSPSDAVDLKEFCEFYRSSNIFWFLICKNHSIR